MTQLGHEVALFVAMHATEIVRPAIVSPRCLALGYTMFAHVKFESALVGLVCIAVGCMNGRASAVTAEVARKCAALTAKAYPPQVPGNPAAGLAKGTVQSKRDYFNKCVANGGNMDDDAPQHPPPPPSRGAASVPQRDRTSELSQSLCPLIQSVAAQNELPVEFFARLIWQESRLRPDAVRQSRARGRRLQRRSPARAGLAPWKTHAAIGDARLHSQRDRALRRGVEAAGRADLAGQHCQRHAMRRDDEGRGKTRACGPERAACAKRRLGGAAHRRSFGEQRAFPIRAAAKEISGDPRRP